MSALAKYMLKKKATVVDGHKHMWEGLKDFGKKNKGRLAAGLGAAGVAAAVANSGNYQDELDDIEDQMEKDEKESRMKKLRKYLEA